MTVPRTCGRRPALYARRAAALASLAGIVALGSVAGAHAASQITGRQIKDGSVSGRDIRDGSLRASKVTLGTLKPADYAGNASGAPGPSGIAGPDNPVPGPAGFRGVEYVHGDSRVVNGFETVTAACPGAEKVIGGGAQFIAGNLTAIITTSFPTADGHAWASTLYQSEAQNGGTSTVLPWALCAVVD
jgi:hypothetical protein